MVSVVSVPLPGRFPGGPGARGDIDPAAVDLDRFLIGPENALVEVAVRAILQDTHHAYSPVVFCGPPGMGKSHLALGLARAWKASAPGRPAKYTTAHDFARTLTDAVQTQAVSDFRRGYRRAWLVVIEDIDQLADKGAAQEELANLLDRMAEASRWVVLTASEGPSQLRFLGPGLQARLGAGLVVLLSPPSLETRVAIVKELAAARGTALAEAAVGVLADHCRTVPEILGALGGLQLQFAARGTPIDGEVASECLACRGQASRPSLEQIAAATAGVFSLSLGQLRGRSQRRTVVTARGVAMYLARRLTDKSLAEIGGYFGGRDHTTVLHGCRKTETLLRSEAEIQEAVWRLQSKL